MDLDLILAYNNFIYRRLKPMVEVAEEKNERMKMCYNHTEKRGENKVKSDKSDSVNIEKLQF